MDMSKNQLPFEPNATKKLSIATAYGTYARYPIKTHLITEGEVLTDLVDRYAAEYLLPDDYLFVSEKIVAISQGRAFPAEEIHPNRPMAWASECPAAWSWPSVNWDFPKSCLQPFALR